MAFLIGILGKLEPIGAIIASLFYGAIKNGGFYVDYKLMLRER